MPTLKLSFRSGLFPGIVRLVHRHIAAVALVNADGTLLQRKLKEAFGGLERAGHDGVRHAMIDKLKRAPAFENRLQFARHDGVGVVHTVDDGLEAENGDFVVTRSFPEPMNKSGVFLCKLHTRWHGICFLIAPMPDGSRALRGEADADRNSGPDFEFLFSRHRRGRTGLLQAGRPGCRARTRRSRRKSAGGSQGRQP